MEAKVDVNTMFTDINAVTRNRPYIDKDGKAKISVYQGGDIHDPKSYTQKLVDNDMAIFTPEEWKEIDKTLREIAIKRQVGIKKLRDLGLIYNLTNPFAVQFYEYWKTSDMQDADVAMSFKITGETDKQAVKTAGVPVPIISWEWGFDIRELQASRMYGRPLDMQGAKIGARKIGEKLESMMFGESAIILGDRKIDSLVSYADNITYTSLSDWSSDSTTPETILADIKTMKGKSIAAKHYGPWILFIPQNFESRLDDDYGIDAEQKTFITLMQRIKSITGIMDVIVSDFLPDSTVVLCQMTSDTVELINGLDITTVQLVNAGGLKFEMLSFAIQSFAAKSDFAGNSGIVVGAVGNG